MARLQDLRCALQTALRYGSVAVSGRLLGQDMWHRPLQTLDFEHEHCSPVDLQLLPQAGIPTKNHGKTQALLRRGKHWNPGPNRGKLQDCCSLTEFEGNDVLYVVCCCLRARFFFLMEHYWGEMETEIIRSYKINVILPAFERSITVKRFKCRKLTKIPQNHQACINIWVNYNNLTVTSLE